MLHVPDMYLMPEALSRARMRSRKASRPARQIAMAARRARSRHG